MSEDQIKAIAEESSERKAAEIAKKINGRYITIQTTIPILTALGLVWYARGEFEQIKKMSGDRWSGTMEIEGDQLKHESNPTIKFLTAAQVREIQHRNPVSTDK